MVRTLRQLNISRSAPALSLERRREYQREQERGVEERKLMIKAIISPGSIGSEYRQLPMPTGQYFRVVSERRTRTLQLTADERGRIVVFNLPSLECPWVHVKTDAEGQIVQAQSYSLPGYENDLDPLYAKKSYGYRFVGNSVTSYNSASLTTMQGMVTCATVPLSMDEKEAPIKDSPGQFCYVRTLDRLPMTSDTVSRITNAFMTGAAAAGSYVALRHTDPFLPFTLRDSDRNKAQFTLREMDPATSSMETKVGDIRNLLAFSDDVNTAYFVRHENPEKGLAAVSALSAMNAGITIYEGLVPGTPIMFKVTALWESIPKMGSDKINEAYKVPPYDQRFIHALSLAQDNSPSAGTAASNSLGDFVKGLGKVWTALSPIAEAASVALPPKIAIPLQAALGIGNAIAGSKPAIAIPQSSLNRAVKQAVQASTASSVVKPIPQMILPSTAPYFNGQTGTATRSGRRQ